MKESQIVNIISNIIEPTLGLSIAEMGITPKVLMGKDEVEVYLELLFPGKFIQDSLLESIKASLYKELPYHTFNITIEQNIKAHRTQLPGKGLRNVKNVIAVASGKGGVGKSTVAVNLATSLAKAGARVGILDADIYGPSIPMMLGEVSPVQMQDGKYLPISAHGIQAMSIGYLTKDESALVWRGPMLAKSLIQMLDITLWGDLDYLIIDLPPGTGDIQLSLVQKIPLAGAVVVTTPQQVATLDAQKAINMFAKTSINTIGIIENMAQHICSNCGHKENIFGIDGAKMLASQTNCKFLGAIPLAQSITESCDKGMPTAIYNNHELADLFMHIAMQSSIELSKRPLNYADKFPHIKATSKQI